MRRIICCFLVIASVFLLCSCSPRNEQSENTVTFYYRNPKTKFGENAKVIIGENRETSSQNQDYQALIEQYLNGPRNYDSVSPFPAGTTLSELSIDSTTAYVVLTPHIATLSSSELMVACACMTKTIIEMTGVHSVKITTADGTLNGEDAIILTADSFTLWGE